MKATKKTLVEQTQDIVSSSTRVMLKSANEHSLWVENDSSHYKISIKHRFSINGAPMDLILNLDSVCLSFNINKVATDELVASGEIANGEFVEFGDDYEAKVTVGAIKLLNTITDAVISVENAVNDNAKKMMAINEELDLLDDGSQEHAELSKVISDIWDSQFTCEPVVSVA